MAATVDYATPRKRGVSKRWAWVWIVGTVVVMGALVVVPKFTGWRPPPGAAPAPVPATPAQAGSQGGR
jgi:hypothetical protein